MRNLGFVTVSLASCFGASATGIGCDAVAVGDGLEPELTVAEDPEDAPFLMIGKADASWDSLGVAILDVANALPASELKRTVAGGGAGLSCIVAGEVVKRRPFVTLRELDEVPFVGPNVVAKLAAFARARRARGGGRRPDRRGL